MKIELHSFDGCPSWQTGLQNLKLRKKLHTLEELAHE